MIEEFYTMVEEQEESGWVWLVYSKDKRALEIKLTENNIQITDLEPSVVPLLAINLQKHAYDYDYESNYKYLQNIMKIIDWKNVADRYKKALK